MLAYGRIRHSLTALVGYCPHPGVWYLPWAKMNTLIKCYHYEIRKYIVYFIFQHIPQHIDICCCILHSHITVNFRVRKRNHMWSIFLYKVWLFSQKLWCHSIISWMPLNWSMFVPCKTRCYSCMAIFVNCHEWLRLDGMIKLKTKHKHFNIIPSTTMNRSSNGPIEFSFRMH